VVGGGMVLYVFTGVPLLLALRSLSFVFSALSSFSR